MHSGVQLKVPSKVDGPNLLHSVLTKQFLLMGTYVCLIKDTFY